MTSSRLLLLLLYAVRVQPLPSRCSSHGPVLGAKLTWNMGHSPRISCSAGRWSSHQAHSHTPHLHDDTDTTKASEAHPVTTSRALHGNGGSTPCQ